ncbi:hypothetical protein KSP40_PGU010496 [Platanthera guangdongensis]|uniref:Uncharacterized protein n=1 Tax=Platanthera guangdongensis TaxID=2320717 RepID=A0ABR2M3C5_9ASPA
MHCHPDEGFGGGEVRRGRVRYDVFMAFRLAAEQRRLWRGWFSKSSKYASWLSSKRPADLPYCLKRVKMIQQNPVMGEFASLTPTPNRDNLAILAEETLPESDVGAPRQIPKHLGSQKGANSQLRRLPPKLPGTTL